jgi:hypothetical protein
MSPEIPLDYPYVDFDEMVTLSPRDAAIEPDRKSVVAKAKVRGSQLTEALA